MPGKLYKMDWCPGARAAMMGFELFNVPVELIEIDIMKGEHRTPEFLQRNPVHTVPVFTDGDLTLHDSHAILAYLSDTYGKDDTFYPKDLKKRAEVNQKLFFDTGILFPRMRNITYYVIVENVKGPTERQLQDLEEAYSFMEEFLSKTKYLAGNEITIADISAISDITTMLYILPLNAEKYPKTQAWIKEMEKQPYVKKHNPAGAAGIGTHYQAKIAASKD